MVLLRALVCDRHIQNNWSEIQNIGTVQFIINQHISTETKSRDLDKVYMKLPEDTDANLAGDEYVELTLPRYVPLQHPVLPAMNTSVLEP
jgi:hypothetical protein